MSIEAYKETVKESEDPRSMERRILSKVTRKIERAASTENGGDPSLNQELAEALDKNRLFWATICHDLTDPENAHEDTFKASMLSLGISVDRETRSVLLHKEGRRSKIDTLIDINRKIIAGLS